MKKSRAKPKVTVNSKELNSKLHDAVKNTERGTKNNVIDFLSEIIINELLKGKIVVLNEFKLELIRNGQERNINRIQKFGGDENNTALVEIKPKIKVTLSKEQIKYIKEHIPKNE